MRGRIVFCSAVQWKCTLYFCRKKVSLVCIQVRQEKAFIDVNNSNCISFKCGTRTAVLLWSLVSFQYQLEAWRRLWWRAHSSPFLSLSSFPFSVVFHSVLPKQLTFSNGASCFSSLLPFCCFSFHLNLSLWF